MIEPLTNPETAVAVKGSMVKSVVLALTSHGLREQVLAKVGPAAAALIRDPPLATMWIDAAPHNEIYQALFDLVGAEKLRTINREAVEQGVSPLLRGTAMRVLRIFGTSPAALLSRFDRVSGTTARGVVYRWTSETDTSGALEIEYPSSQNVPMGAFVATGGALGILFELCGVQGSFGDPAWIPNGRHNRARFAVSWR